MLVRIRCAAVSQALTAASAPAGDLVAGAEIALDSLLGEMLRIRAIEEIVVARSVVDQQSGIAPVELAGRVEKFLRSDS